MPLTEEVDEINEYLKARRKKQELGELPRQDLTPSFVKRMSNALFGEKIKPKVPLQSMQPTYASPVAQSAVRKQLDEIMQERTTKPNPASAPVRIATPSPPKPLPPIPRYPESNVWASAAKPAVSLPPKPAPAMRTPTPVPVPAMKAATNSPWGLWNKAPTPTPAAPAPPVSMPLRTPTPVSPPITRAPAPSPNPTPLSSTSARSAFPSYSSIAAAPPKPYQDIPALSSKGPASPANKVFDPISSVRTNPPTNTSPAMSPSSPVRAESAPVTPPARTGYAPPWVTRTAPKPGITPTLPSKQKQTAPFSIPAQLEIAPPAVSQKNNPPVAPSPVVPRDENKTTPSSSFSPRGKPWVTGVLPKEAGDDFAPARMMPIPVSNSDETPPAVPSRNEQPSEPISFSRSGSGEVRVDELARAVRRAQDESTPPVIPPTRDAALNEEISEEEAIGRLPFEEVEGLSESDLAYLERKEKEHAQTHDEELDQGDPAALRAHLEEQSQKLQANPLNISQDDPKKEILRRLKKMMEENPHQP